MKHHNSIYWLLFLFFLVCNVQAQELSSDAILVSGACEKDEARMLDMLEKGSNINTKTSSGVTPLMKAAYCGNINVVQLLINKGANVNEKDNRGATALMFSARDSNVQIGKLLLKNGARADDIDHNKCSAIFYIGRDKGNVHGIDIKDSWDDNVLIQWYDNDIEAMRLFAKVLFDAGLKTTEPILLVGPFMKMISTTKRINGCSLDYKTAFSLKDTMYPTRPFMYRYERTSTLKGIRYSSSFDMVRLRPYLDRGKVSDVWFSYCSEHDDGDEVTLGSVQLH